MRYWRLEALAAALLLTLCVATAKVKVACMGNSITFGYTLPDPATQSYPALLAKMLPADYEVRNFGHSGATVLRKGHNPYVKTPEYKAAIDFRPDIAVIHLGVNDTDPRDWPNYNSEFQGDFMSMIEDLRRVNPAVRILVARLTPLRATHYRFKSGTRDWRLLAQDAIERTARKAGVELIDFDEPFRDRQELLWDGIHPNVEGTPLLAQEVYKGITGKYGPLAMPPVYGSGMVLPHSRYLTLRGTTDSNLPVEIKIDGRTYRTRADNRGRWSIIVPPLTPGGIYTIDVSDGKSKLHFDDVAAGIVWIASGQSNMAFMMKQDHEGRGIAKSASDPMLRFFDMKPVALTNSGKWTQAQIDSTDRLQHFLASKWQGVAPENAPELSAVAYFFGRELRDSLGLPVGIISNSIGGSGTEAWVDINTLERIMPEILLNWRKNDYVQKWVQGRALENTGDHRHPYEPGYLFAAGIRPLGHYPIDGAIWYQGESNAHNIELHERLFAGLVDSWRREFGNDSLPFCFVQLSSLNRPSWPEFRDSQRRLAASIPGTYMAVSSDHGDSLDVHPRQKRSVGHRLALLALRNTYGHTPEAYGPQPVKALRTDAGKVKVSFSHARGLTTSDGLAPRKFEVAAADRFFVPATAQINDNDIILTAMDIKNPRFVRYAWEPFTRSNVINADSLPASTFEIEVENFVAREPEKGIEAGLSGCFAAPLGSMLLIAGGCNFPGDPFAPGAAKKFYRGIYAADTAAMRWRRIGDMPQSVAYGATAVTPRGIVLMGGSTPQGSVADCYLLKVDNGMAELSELPSLPEPVDNAYAAAVGNKVYLAGGNINGKPSRELFCLNLDSADSEWKRLRQMPGNARVQPVMAAGRDAKGEDALYVFGGFAGGAPRHEPTLELQGLRYSISRDKWMPVAGPTTPAGEALSLGGGAACTLPDGRIAAAGGVNKDIFLEALRNQAPDYLQHDPAWYRFNPFVLLFDPGTERWSVAAEDASETARAGASIFPARNGFYIYGGELKPRVRTPQTTFVRCEK